MLEALHKYADDNSLAARPGFKTKNVKYYIMFSANGDFLGFDPVTVPLMCPDIGSLANGTSKSNIIAEKAEVIFNIPEEKNGTQVYKREQKQKFYMDALKQASEYDPLFKAAVNGFEKNLKIIKEEFSKLSKAKGGDVLSISVDGKPLESIYKSRQQACSLFYDVRTFGGVLSTGPNAGQVRGPVQIAFAKSLDPILPLDISITRMCKTEDVKGAKSYEDYENAEKDADAESLRTMGRKQFISYGLYEARGFISANLAAETGFDESDLKALFEAVLNMYEHDHSASKGEMAVVSPLIIFKHIGTDTDKDQRARQAKLGCSPAYKLFELVTVKKKDGVELPRNYTDYDFNVKISAVPDGVQIGFLDNPYGDIVWDKLPDNSVMQEI